MGPQQGGVDACVSCLWNREPSVFSVTVLVILRPAACRSHIRALSVVKASDRLCADCCVGLLAY